ncbi:hypothetical protein DLG20_20780, partial [Salmonella enterica]|nr:hypothetical protein [Salmonella enterica]EAP0343004.1 hypothetical protein [Salmonella enterica]
YFKLHVLRLRSLTPVTYFSKLPEIRSLAAFLQLELFRVYRSRQTRNTLLHTRRITCCACRLNGAVLLPGILIHAAIHAAARG